MANDITFKLKSYIQPFEHSLALEELQALAESSSGPTPVHHSEYMYSIRTSKLASEFVNRLAYWEKVNTPTELITKQSLRESTVNVVRNGVPLREIHEKLPFSSAPPLPNRRCLRYGPHGIHEYRGKFFPQLVRSLLNIARVPRDGVVVDSMCGSGTTLVEALLAGFQAHGLDMNPLSAEITRVKCALLSADTEILESSYERIRRTLLEDRPFRLSASTIRELPAKDQSYLAAWFPAHALRDIDRIFHVISSISDEPSKGLFRISLSNVLRKVSWQKDDDLRIRKEVLPDSDDDPIREFLDEVGRSVRNVVAFLSQNGRLTSSRYSVTEGDARTADRTWSRWRGRVDAVITSPPYATALPYLDTDRLSLIWLRLLERSEHRRRDDAMIGNREVTERGRRAYWALFEGNAHLLPDSIQHLIRRIEFQNAGSDAGFRKRNLPALLAKYFLDMRLVLQGIKKLLKPGCPAFVVVGNNHTTAGGERIEIATSSLLSELGSMVGFDVGTHRSMDMLTSRDIFRKNAMASEVILELRR